MHAGQARRPVTMVIGSSSRLLRAQLRARNFRRHYSQQSSQPSRTSGGSRKWAGPVVALLGTFSAATAAWIWQGQQATPEVQTPRRVQKVTFEKSKVNVPMTEEQNREILSAQYARIKNMAANPGVYIWGSNSYGVVDPESKETIIKEPRRFRYFDGQILRDIKLNETSGAAVTEKGDLVQWGKGFSKIDFQPTPTLTGKKIGRAHV